MEILKTAQNEVIVLGTFLQMLFNLKSPNYGRYLVIIEVKFL